MASILQRPLAEPRRGMPVAAPRALPRASEPAVHAHRIDAPGTALGLTPPPCTVHVWFMEGGRRLLAIMAPGRARRVAQWLHDLGVDDVDVEAGLSPRSLWFPGAQMPEAWRPLLDDAGQRRLELTVEGTATLFVEDARAAERLVDLLGQRGPGVTHRPAIGRSSALTFRQGEALTLAAALGYYEVPRRVSLRVLASKMGLSQGAASELLRRAERTLIMGFCDTWGEEQSPV